MQQIFYLQYETFQKTKMKESLKKWMEKTVSVCLPIYGDLRGLRIAIGTLGIF